VALVALPAPLRVIVTPDADAPLAVFTDPEMENVAPLKLAVIVFGAFIVTAVGLPVLLIEPLQERKVYPAFATAVKFVDAPLLNQHPAEQSGVTVPSPAGLTDVVNRY
jgi:hypothetical protein